jgi:hypothetical protein
VVLLLLLLMLLLLLHEPSELVEVDPAVAVEVGLRDHRLDLEPA